MFALCHPQHWAIVTQLNPPELSTSVNHCGILQGGGLESISIEIDLVVFNQEQFLRNVMTEVKKGLVLCQVEFIVTCVVSYLQQHGSHNSSDNT